MLWSQLDALLWFVLCGPVDGDLILPVAWDTALTAKQSGLYHAPRMHTYVVSHGQDATEDVVEKLTAGARAFFYYAATPASSLGARAAELPPLPSRAGHVLTGRHWLAGDGLQGSLCC